MCRVWKRAKEVGKPERNEGDSPSPSLNKGAACVAAAVKALEILVLCKSSGSWKRVKSRPFNMGYSS